MAKGIYYEGQMFYLPGTHSKLNTSALSNTSVEVNNKLVLMGEADSGEPGKLKTISSKQEAIDYLSGGPLLQAFIFAYSPSSVMSRAGNIAVMNIRELTQATADLKNSSTTVLKLKSSVYGTRGNQLSVDIDSNEITISAPWITNSLTGEFGLKIVSLTHSTAKLSISVDSMTITGIGAESADVVFKFSEHKTVGALKAALKNYPAVTVSWNIDISDNQSTEGLFDYVDNQALTPAYWCKGDLYSLANYINTVAKEYITAEVPDGQGIAPTDGAYLLSGAEKGSTPTALTWGSSLAKLEDDKSIDCIVAIKEGYDDSLNDSIDANGYAHVAAMSAIKEGKRRRYIGSANNNKAISDLDTRTGQINMDRGLFVGSGFYDYDYFTGKERLFHPSFLAAKIGSMMLGSNPQVSLTSQPISAIRPEKTYTKGEKESLIKAGALFIHKSDAGTITIPRMYSTWRQDGNYAKVEPSVLRCLDYCMNDTEVKMEAKKQEWLRLGYSIIAADVVSVVQEASEKHEEEKWIQADDDKPAFSNITAKVENDSFSWNVELHPPIPKNYGFGEAIAV